MKKKKMLVNERQYLLIKEQDTVQNIMVKRIVDYLNDFYEPVVGIFAGTEEYSTGGLISNKIDGTTISPKALRDHLKFKFGDLNEKFYEQVITDWHNHKIKDDGLLSKSVKM